MAEAQKAFDALSAVVVNDKAPAKTLRELIALAKMEPGKLLRDDTATWAKVIKSAGIPTN